MKKTIFITGAAGLIGRNLVSTLANQGHKVICFDLGEQFIRSREFFEKHIKSDLVKVVPGTILDRSYLAASMRGADAVFHLAAMLGVKRTEDNRLRCIEINVSGTDNVLDAAVKNGIKRFIFASSSEVYGEPNENPISEKTDTKGKTVYAVTKLAGEELTKGYSQLYPWMKHTVIRFFNTYGEGQVAQFVIVKWIHRVLSGKNPVVYGSGEQLRSYGHVADVIDGLIKVLESEISWSKTYNLGNSTQIYSLNDLAQTVIDVLAPNAGLKVERLNSFGGSDRSESREIFSRYCDTTLAAEELGFSPKVTVEEGIRRIAAAGNIQVDWPFNP